MLLAAEEKQENCEFIIMSIGSAGTGVMNPKVWGSLQHHISLLENVYLRLPLREQLQLRGVCKEWDATASQRRCSTDVIRKPFFVVAVQDESESFGKYTVVGILTFHVASGCWRWTRLSDPKFTSEPSTLPFSVEGIVFIVWMKHFLEFVDAYQHPPQHTCVLKYGCGDACGLAVRAPHSFQFIAGHPKDRTMLLDSAAEGWEERPSRMPHVEKDYTTCKACVHFGDEVFIWSQEETIFVYSLETDVWSVLETPPSSQPGAGGALGAWDGRIFLFSCLSLWELVDRAKFTWRRFADVPVDIHAWLVPPRFQERVRVYASFSQEHVLVHTLVCETSAGASEGIRSKRFALFNLATKKWEKEEMCAVEAYGEIKKSFFDMLEKKLEKDSKEEMCAVEAYGKKMNSGQWDASVERFTEDRQRILPCCK